MVMAVIPGTFLIRMAKKCVLIIHMRVVPVLEKCLVKQKEVSVAAVHPNGHGVLVVKPLGNTKGVPPNINLSLHPNGWRLKFILALVLRI